MTRSVSLIIPCYNHAATLERALRSALEQGALADVIVVDDHSTDGSWEALQKLALEDSRIRAMRTGRNMGPGGARNAGAHVARGTCLCFLDADDELLGDFCGEALAMMSAHPEMRVVKGEMEFFDAVKGYILPEFDPRHRSAVLSSSCGTVIDKATFVRMGGFPEDLRFRGPAGGEDVAFMEAVMEHFQPIGRIERPCYRVWSRAGSHVDGFLARTRLSGAGFEFVDLLADQAPGGLLAQSLAAYRTQVAARLARTDAPAPERMPAGG